MGAAKLLTAAGGGVTLDAASTATDKTITVPARTGNMAVDGPAFSAYMLNGSANQGISSATFTKIKVDTEVFDTASCYDPTTYRFTPNVAGYYQISGGMSYSGSTTATRGMCLVYKNGAADKRLGDMIATGNGMAGSVLIYMNGSTDYVEMYAYISAVSAVVDYGHTVTWFTGALLRAA